MCSRSTPAAEVRRPRTASSQRCDCPGRSTGAPAQSLEHLVPLLRPELQEMVAKRWLRGCGRGWVGWGGGVGGGHPCILPSSPPDGMDTHKVATPYRTLALAGSSLPENQPFDTRDTHHHQPGPALSRQAGRGRWKGQPASRHRRLLRATRGRRRWRAWALRARAPATSLRTSHVRLRSGGRASSSGSSGGQERRSRWVEAEREGG